MTEYQERLFTRSITEGFCCYECYYFQSVSEFWMSAVPWFESDIATRRFVIKTAVFFFFFVGGREAFYTKREYLPNLSPMKSDWCSCTTFLHLTFDGAHVKQALLGKMNQWEVIPTRKTPRYENWSVDYCFQCFDSFNFCRSHYF